MKHIPFPRSNDYAMYYDQYLEKIDRNIPLLKQLKDTAKEVVAMYKSWDKDQLLYRYAAGKWSRKDVLQHLVDVESVFSYRAMRFSRGDQTPLSFFDENEYARSAQADKKSLPKLVREYMTTRNATIAFFDGLSKHNMHLKGVASQFPMSVSACGWIILAHERHHIRVLQERYGL
ncbi:MAG: DinB family protein [Taibaiella sp.]|nr:DinB family protein [Taibaiella sp.]